MKIIDYITEEVRRQGHDVTQSDGIIRISWMSEAWEYARVSAHSQPTIQDIEFLGKLIERDKNADGFRHCLVRVGPRICCAPTEILPRLERLWDSINDATPIEFYKEFELIHPFRDGNGRAGKILLNWLNRTLDDPIFPPSDLF